MHKSRPQRRIRSKKDHREQSKREGRGDVAVGWREKRARMWAVRHLLRKQKGLCALCGEPMNLSEGDDKQATLDHIFPVSKGGADVITNLQLACRLCNNEKGDSVEKGLVAPG